MVIINNPSPMLQRRVLSTTLHGNSAIEEVAVWNLDGLGFTPASADAAAVAAAVAAAQNPAKPAMPTWLKALLIALPVGAIALWAFRKK